MSALKRSGASRHVPDYAILLLGLTICFGGFWLSWPFTSAQRLWAILIAVFYVCWGSWHHARTDGHLSWTIVAEYGGLALLILIILLGAISY